MVSGSLGKDIIPEIYYKYRFKGIVIFTSLKRKKELIQKDFLKNYPKIS